VFCFATVKFDLHSGELRVTDLEVNSGDIEVEWAADSPVAP